MKNYIINEEVDYTTYSIKGSEIFISHNKEEDNYTVENETGIIGDRIFETFEDAEEYLENEQEIEFEIDFDPEF